jgi:hypothetical protein
MIQLLVKVDTLLRPPTCQQVLVLFISYEEIINCCSLVTIHSMDNNFRAAKYYSDRLIQTYARGQVINCFRTFKRQLYLGKASSVSLQNSFLRLLLFDVM